MMLATGQILILSGPPGSGKTTTARALADTPGVPKVHLHTDDFWHFIRHGAIPPWLPEAHEQNRVVMDVLAKVAQGYAAGGYFVVLDGIVGPWFLAPFRGLDTPAHYVVLRPPLEAAIRRCHERGGDTLRDPGPITALHAQFAALGPFEAHAIRTDGFTPQQTLSHVIAAVASGAFRLAAAAG